MERKDKLNLTEKQMEIIARLEKVLKEAWDAEIGFVTSNLSTIYAYNNTLVSCFYAPENAAYEDDVYVCRNELHKLHATIRCDEVRECEKVRVGLYLDDKDWEMICHKSA